MDNIEKLDICNIIEVQKIRKILIKHPDLLSIFEILIIMSNNRINQEKHILKMEIEENIEPDLSSDDEDEIFE
ncbi:hypothetical protein [Marinobacter sp.]|uniref:hypothetical protein n=1 Tax=Marinobacter sp. TaxID=50741 RepID=UPI000C8C07BB|nr:hypothetical protein [Marinobacter sp.]MAB53674.1 hypothetical protein [Marinobacter sp.]